MTKLKTVALILIISLCTFLCGCASVEYKMIVKNNGNVVEVFTVRLDEQEIENAGYNVEELKDKIKNDAANLITEDVLSYYFRLEIDQMPQGSAERKYYEEGVKISSGWEKNEFNMTVAFMDVSIYYLFYNIVNPGSEDNEVEEKHLFYNITTYYTKTAFYGINFQNQLLKSYADSYPEFTKADIDYFYSYAVDSPRWHSNANYQRKVGGEYVHTWALNANELNREIYLYKITANQWPWMVLGISAGLLFSAVLIFISIHKNKKNKK